MRKNSPPVLLALHAMGRHGLIQKKRIGKRRVGTNPFNEAGNEVGREAAVRETFGAR